MQWRNEIATHTDGLKVLVWHGASRKSDIKEMIKYDVVCQLASLVHSLMSNFRTDFDHLLCIGKVDHFLNSEI